MQKGRGTIENVITTHVTIWWMFTQTAEGCTYLQPISKEQNSIACSQTCVYTKNLFIMVIELLI